MNVLINGPGSFENGKHDIIIIGKFFQPAASASSSAEWR